MARVKPRLIKLLVGAVDPTDRSGEVSKAVISSAASDWVPLSGPLARDYSLQMTIAQDHASGTLWDTIWTGTGTIVQGVYAPYGNEDPSTSQPHYSFEAYVQEPDGDFLGAQSSTSYSAVATVDVVWPLVDKPAKVTA